MVLLSSVKNKISLQHSFFHIEDKPQKIIDIIIIFSYIYYNKLRLNFWFPFHLRIQMNFQAVSHLLKAHLK